MRYKATLKDAYHLHIREKVPYGKPIGWVGVDDTVYLTGEEKRSDTVEWVEGYISKDGKVTRGWMAKRYLNIVEDPEFGNPPVDTIPPPDVPDIVIDDPEPIPQKLPPYQEPSWGFDLFRDKWDATLGWAVLVVVIALIGFALFGCAAAISKIV